jgi:transposase-like protein/Zn finger protein HypA/HybF involved in hydrogenase expression
MNNNVTQVDQTTFIVNSQHTPSKSYKVAWNRKKWICNCDDYLKHKKTCKHIHAVRYYLLLQSITSAVKHINEEPYCPKCKSKEFIIKRGYRYNKSGPVQRYYCKKCMVKFTYRTTFKGMKNKVEAIVSALDLYFRGVSLRQLAEHLELTYGIKVSHGTVYNWIKKYVQLVNKYVARLKVNSSDRWHMDDTLVRVSGRHMVIWGLLDSETRFLLALQVSSKRGAEEAQRLIQKGLNAAKKSPSELVSDGLDSYRIAIEKEFNPKMGRGDVIHIRGPLTVGFNNKMERFHGVLKNRVKTMCRFQNGETAKTFVNGFETYYNFIRGHRALNGKTPAQATKLTPNKENWLNLILKAEKHNI